MGASCMLVRMGAGEAAVGHVWWVLRTGNGRPWGQQFCSWVCAPRTESRSAHRHSHAHVRSSAVHKSQQAESTQWVPLIKFQFVNQAQQEISNDG